MLLRPWMTLWVGLRSITRKSLNAEASGPKVLRLPIRKRRLQALTPPATPARPSAARAWIGLVHPYDEHHRSGLDIWRSTLMRRPSTSSWLAVKARTHLAQPSIRNEQNPQLAPPHLRPLGGGSGEGVDGLDLQDLNLSDRPLNRVTSTSCRRGALEITDSGAPRPTLELRQIAGCALVADPVGRAFCAPRMNDLCFRNVDLSARSGAHRVCSAVADRRFWAGTTHGYRSGRRIAASQASA